MAEVSIQAVPAIERFIVGRLRGTIYDDPADLILVSELAALPTGNRIHRMPADDATPFPYLAFARRGIPATNGTIGGPVTSAMSVYEIKAIDESTSKERIQRPAEILFALLDQRSGMSSGLWVECTNESELLIDLPPEDNGRIFQHAGGLFRFFVSAV